MTTQLREICESLSQKPLLIWEVAQAYRDLEPWLGLSIEGGDSSNYGGQFVAYDLVLGRLCTLVRSLDPEVLDVPSVPPWKRVQMLRIYARKHSALHGFSVAITDQEQLLLQERAAVNFLQNLQDLVLPQETTTSKGIDGWEAFATNSSLNDANFIRAEDYINVLTELWKQQQLQVSEAAAVRALVLRACEHDQRLYHLRSAL